MLPGTSGRLPKRLTVIPLRTECAPMDRLTAMQGFVRVVEVGSFSALRAGRRRLSGWLRVAASVGFERLKLLPVVHEFLDRHPDVRIDLRLADGLAAHDCLVCTELSTRDRWTFFAGPGASEYWGSTTLDARAACQVRWIAGCGRTAENEWFEVPWRAGWTWILASSREPRRWQASPATWLGWGGSAPTRLRCCGGVRRSAPAPLSRPAGRRRSAAAA